MPLNRKFFISLGLHVLHGLLVEKSKLYFPYTLDRNLLLIRTDLFKFYLSLSFIYLGFPYIFSRCFPNQYHLIRSHVEHRYRSRSGAGLQIGSYLQGVSLAFTGFCLSYIPIYLAISPILFLYSIAAGYTAYIFYHIVGRVFFSRMRFGPVRYEIDSTSNCAFISR